MKYILLSKVAANRMLSPWRLAKIIDLVWNHRGPGVCFGSYDSSTACLLCTITRRPVVAVDWFRRLEGGPRDPENVRRLRGACRASESAAINAIRESGLPVTLIVGDVRELPRSPDWGRAVSEVGPFAWAFIDLDTYEPTLAALRTWYAHKAAPSVAIIDDAGPRFRGVIDAVDDFCAQTGAQWQQYLGPSEDDWLGVIEAS